jgi:hypothetical protein
MSLEHFLFNILLQRCKTSWERNIITFLIKNMIFWRKIVIFHTKYPKKFRASLRSTHFFLSAPPPTPLTWNPGSAPGSYNVLLTKIMIGVFGGTFDLQNDIAIFLWRNAGLWHIIHYHNILLGDLQDFIISWNHSFDSENGSIV